jgi:putative SOS response-associated peptidase YedK
MKGYALYSPTKSIEIHLKSRLPKSFKARYNIRSGDSTPILVDKQEALYSKWGLIPYETQKVDNNEIEILKPFKDIKELSNRCVIPLNAFYMWKGDENPFVCQPQNGKLMAALGTWDSWEMSPGKILHSFAFSSLPSAAQFEQVGESVPVIVPWEECETWLNGDSQNISQDFIFETDFNITQASPLIKSSKEDNPQLLNKTSGLIPGENLSLF